MNQLLSQLNPSQRQAVEYCDGPSLVIAGAGSGKTRVLTYKIAYLLTQGYRADNILALTFTNKAANEMKERITQLVGTEARRLFMGTFHSVFARILRIEAHLIGYTSQFTIYDESDSRSLLKSIIKEYQLDDKIYKPATVHNRISMAKNEMMLPSDYARSATFTSRDRDARMDKMPMIYEAYQNRLRQSNAMDFDDLLVYTYILFRDNEQTRSKYNQRFRYVLVDEYQDTNSVQQKIVLQLVRDHNNVCVVGDDAQSIYGFRGAKIDNILGFEQYFESLGGTPARLFKLEQNYRSTQSIVAAANSLIQHNQRQIQKQVFSENAVGEHLKLKYCYSDREEAIIVCNEIKRLRRTENLSYDDFAILYRTNAQSRTFEEQMRKDAIPYRIFGGLSFYQRKEIKDVIAYFRLVVNPHDEEALRRIINYPARGIGNTTLEKVFAHARLLNVSPWDVICQPAAVGLNVSKATVNKLTLFADMIKDFIAAANDPDGEYNNAYLLGRHIVETAGVAKDIYSGSDPDDISRQENLQELIDSIREFVDVNEEESGAEHIALSDFLQEVSLMSDLDSDDNSREKVVLMTIHSAKGLEFPTVFIVGLEENIFPSPMCCDSIRGLEEERRLFYVAITRAEKHCYLTSAQSRYRYGRMEFDTPSRFINDIDPRLVDIEDEKSFSKSYSDSKPFGKPFGQQSKPVDRTHAESSGITAPALNTRSFLTRDGRRMTRISSTPSSFSSGTGAASSAASSTDLSVGDRIEHNRFGRGTVLKVEGTGENTKATVEFTNVGTKQLLLRFAKYTKL